MDIREIKTTLAVDGERAFNKAVTEAGRNMRVMASEMKSAAADFNLTGDEMEYLGRKSKSLNSQIAQQEAIIKALEGAVRDSAEAYGDASAKTDGYRIKLNNANASLSKLRKELEDNDRQMLELGRDAGRVGRQLEQGLGESADDVSRKMDSLVNTLSSDVGDLKKMVSFTTFTEIGGGMLEGAKNIYEGARQISEGTREYRREMSFLELNAANAGLDTGKIKEKAFEIASITGNLDGAVEGLNSLISSRLDMDELTLATERLIGAALELPGVLTFEGLAEGFQESVVSGTPTGQYMELLERMAQEYGDVEKYVEDINESFKEAPQLEARQTVGLAWLSEHGFEQNKKTWEENNKGIKEATDAQNKLNDAWAETGEIIEPVMTKIDQSGATILNEVNSFLKDEETPLTKAAAEAGKKAGRWVNGILNSEDSKELEQNAHLYWQQQKDIVVDQMKSVFEEEEDEDMSAWMNFQKLLMRDEDTGALGKKASEEFLKGMHDYILENTPAVERDSKAAGKGIGSGLGDGVLEQTPYAVSQVRNMMALMQAEVNKGIVMPTIPVSIKGNTNGGSALADRRDLNVNVNMSMDGKTLSKAQGEYISNEMGSRVDRIEKYT